MSTNTEPEKTPREAFDEAVATLVGTVEELGRQSGQSKGEMVGHLTMRVVTSILLWRMARRGDTARAVRYGAILVATDVQYSLRRIETAIKDDAGRAQAAKRTAFDDLMSRGGLG